MLKHRTGNALPGNLVAYQCRFALESLSYSSIGIDDSSHAALYKGKFGERLHFFAVQRLGPRVEVRHAYYHYGKVIEEISS